MSIFLSIKWNSFLHKPIEAVLREVSFYGKYEGVKMNIFQREGDTSYTVTVTPMKHTDIFPSNCPCVFPIGVVFLACGDLW